MSIFSSSSKLKSQGSVKNKGNIMDGSDFSHVYSGSRYLGSRKGDSSVLDANQANLEYKKKQAEIGAGAYILQYKNPNGDPLKNYVIEQDGHAFVTNDNGEIYFVDEHWMNEKYKEIEEIEEYIRKIMKMCKTDEMGQRLLGLSKQDFVKLCSESGDFSADGKDPSKIYLPDETAKVNCLPSMLTLYPPNSTIEAMAFAKLKAIVRAYMPAIKKAKETKPHGMEKKKTPEIPDDV